MHLVGKLQQAMKVVDCDKSKIDNDIFEGCFEVSFKKGDRNFVHKFSVDEVTEYPVEHIKRILLRDASKCFGGEKQ